MTFSLREQSAFQVLRLVCQQHYRSLDNTVHPQAQTSSLDRLRQQRLPVLMPVTFELSFEVPCYLFQWHSPLRQ